MNNRFYGDGKSIIEILNIGFEPLLTREEYEIFQKIGELKKNIYINKRSSEWIRWKLLYLERSDVYYKWLNEYKIEYDNNLTECTREVEENKAIFRQMLQENISITRTLHDDREFSREEQFRNIAIFESDLTRSFGCEDMTHSEDIVSVVTYYTEIFESIMHNGFIYKDKKFVFYTAGAGQTRNKKSTFVSEYKLNENFNRLFCGLTMEDINKQGGMNTNKYLAYTSLSQSNTSIWEDFDIDKSIVVDDIEFFIPNQKVRYIYTETPEDKLNILNLQNEVSRIGNELREIVYIKSTYEKGYRRTKEEVKKEKDLKELKKKLSQEIEDIKSKYHKTSIQHMDVMIPFSDGFGINLKKSPNAMVRIPFVKGLNSYVPRSKFKTFCRENGFKIHKVKDIYGKEHSIDDIDYIFTKSQFKMYKYFNNEFDENGNLIKTGWEVYKDNFKKYGCNACRCNIEGDVKLNAKTNYQILQTLTTEMTDKDILSLAKEDIMNINGIGKDVQSMLNILGANEEKNNRLNSFQKSLLLYPEMLRDYYVRNLLKNTKDSLIKKLRSGKFNVNGSYIFIIPEPLACLQWWFCGERDLSKLGLLKEGEIYCNLFQNGEILDCLRSPHLDHAHCLRKNVRNSEIDKWYRTKGVYVGVNDIMSKILMNDNDGDTALVHNNGTIINCAKSFQKKYGMIPSYYEMQKANPQEINIENLFDGIVMAYHHGNIGTPSNEITKIFDTLNLNSTREEIMEAIEVVALRCADVNSVIDYAKTLYKPTIPKEVVDRYKKYSKRKVPRFFMYAKDKRLDQVEDATDNNINRIEKIVRSNRIVFKDLVGKYSYKNLMSEDVDITTEKAQEIIELYLELDKNNVRKLSQINIRTMDYDEKRKFFLLTEYNAKKQKELFLEWINESSEYITNVLVKGLRGKINHDTLWKLFGDDIYKNIQKNLDGTKQCKCCGERFVATNNRSKYCKECYEKTNRNNALSRYFEKKNS